MDMEKVIRIIDELIFEAQKAQIWKAENALRCLKKELLKEQEAVEPRKIKGFQMPLYLRFGYECGNCETPLLKDQPYCAGCGKPVKWDA